MCGVVDVVVVQKLLAVTTLRDDDDDLSKNVTSISVVGIMQTNSSAVPTGP